jgi:L-ascorbate metabolism protein UlaG (beta-lactamase superfamily)
MSLSITWLGHSTFLIGLPSGQRLVTDPWLSNPGNAPGSVRADGLGRIDLILVSHGHGDHMEDVPALSRATGAPIVCLFELGQYLVNKGVQNVRDMGLGGTQTIDGIRITMTPAVHSGSITDTGGRIIYLGGAAGFVIRADGTPTIYFAGDTALFGDMRLIGERYAPDIAFLPIGDHYTMGPADAATAAEWLGVRQVVPMHWGTFPILTGTPDALRDHLKHTSIDVLALRPGETAR